MILPLTSTISKDLQYILFAKITDKMTDSLTNCIDENVVAFSVSTGVLCISLLLNIGLGLKLLRRPVNESSTDPEISLRSGSERSVPVAATSYDLPDWVVSSFRKSRQSLV